MANKKYSVKKAISLAKAVAIGAGIGAIGIVADECTGRHVAQYANQLYHQLGYAQNIEHVPMYIGAAAGAFVGYELPKTTTVVFNGVLGTAKVGVKAIEFGATVLGACGRVIRGAYNLTVKTTQVSKKSKRKASLEEMA